MFIYEQIHVQYIHIIYMNIFIMLGYVHNIWWKNFLDNTDDYSDVLRKHQEGNHS